MFLQPKKSGFEQLRNNLGVFLIRMADCNSVWVPIFEDAPGMEPRCWQSRAEADRRGESRPGGARERPFDVGPDVDGLAGRR